MEILLIIALRLGILRGVGGRRVGSCVVVGEGLLPDLRFMAILKELKFYKLRLCNF